jgi:signal transduction histidine kinase
MAIFPERFTRLLQEQNFPADVLATILDQRSMIIAHSQKPEQFVGQPAHPTRLAALATSDTGWEYSRTVEQVPVYSAWTRSAVTGWTTVISVTEASITRPIHRSLALWASGGLLALEPDRWPDPRALRGDVVASGVEFLYMNEDRREIWTRVMTAPFHNAEGKITGAIMVIQDIDALKRAEAALRDLNATLEQRVVERTLALEQAMAAQQRLERAAQRAEHFALLGRLAAGVAHELRNPLGAVFLHVDVLAEELAQPSPDSPEAVAEALAAIKTSLARVDDLMQDYLALVRVHTIQREMQDLGAAVAAWSREFQGVVAAHGVTLTMDGIARLGPVAFHASTLRRALLNLVQNAAEAMPQGGTVTLAGQGTADQVQLEVRDTGSGIPAERLAQIFEPLHTTKPGGTGLGLYLAQEIVTAHGGQITVESTVGQGTTFILTLPRAAR